MVEQYKDRRGELFGREIALRMLTDRARRAGLTAVTGRPLMGKSSALLEMARRLTEEGAFVVGAPEGVSSIVSGFFDELAKADEDLMTGGVPLAPLPYDQALSGSESPGAATERQFIRVRTQSGDTFSKRIDL
jgi:hypothetical protein